MSLNKLTDVSTGINLALNIGANEIQCTTMTCESLICDDISLPNAISNIEADNVKVNKSLIVVTDDLKELEYSTPNAGLPNDVLTTDGNGSLYFSSLPSTDTDLQTSYNVSTSPQITTDDSKGDVIFKRGTTGGDGDIVVSVSNNSDVKTLTVSGNGDVVSNEITTNVVKGTNLFVEASNDLELTGTTSTLLTTPTLTLSTNNMTLDSGADIILNTDAVEINGNNTVTFLTDSTTIQSGTNINLNSSSIQLNGESKVTGILKVDEIEANTGVLSLKPTNGGFNRITLDDAKNEVIVFATDKLNLNAGGPVELVGGASGDLITIDSSGSTLTGTNRVRIEDLAGNTYIEVRPTEDIFLAANNDVNITALNNITITQANEAGIDCTNSGIDIDAGVGNTRTSCIRGPFKLWLRDSTQEAAIVAQQGDMIFNTTLNAARVYNGAMWVSL
jgi:hypothetical protein